MTAPPAPRGGERALERGERASLLRLEEADRRDDALRRSLGMAPPRRPAPAATDAYLAGLLARAPLGEEELSRLAALAREGRADAREALIEAVLPRVVAGARRYAGQGTEFADLVQEGVLAVLVALGRYRPEAGTPFWAYALPWVRGAMSRLVSDQRRAVRLPPRARRDLAALKEAAASWDGPGRPTLAETAARAGIDHARAAALARADPPARSLQEPADAEGELPLQDTIPDPDAADQYQEVVRAAGAPALGALLGALSAREREVVERRFGLGERPEESLREVGERLAVSRERVRQIEARALRKLAAALGHS